MVKDRQSIPEDGMYKGYEVETVTVYSRNWKKASGAGTQKREGAWAAEGHIFYILQNPIMQV